MKLYLLPCTPLQGRKEEILPRLPQGRQAAFARSGSLLTLGAGLLLCSLLGVRRDEDLVYGPQGKPGLACGSPQFSLSHSKDHVLLVTSDSLIGADMEPEERLIHAAARKRVCLPQETNMDFLTVFTRKECAMKLTGLGFSLPLSEIDTTKPFLWEGQKYDYSTCRRAGFVISVLAREPMSEIQLVDPEALL